MSGFDLTEANAAAWQRIDASNTTLSETIAESIAAAAPVIERLVRERIAADIEARRDKYSYSWWRSAIDEAADVARGSTAGGAS